MRFRPSLLSWSLLVIGVLSLPASSAFAQVNAARPERPDRGLYRSGVAGTTDLLAVSGSAGAGWDDNILLDLPGNSDPRNATGESGSIVNTSAALSYSVSRRRFNFGASAASTARYYPGQQIDYLVAHSGNVAAAYSFNDRTSLSASQTISYQPFTFEALFPYSFDPALQLDAVQTPALQFAASRQQFLQYSSAVGFARTLNRRTTFNAGYHFGQSDTASGSDKYTTQGGNAGLYFSLTRNLGIRAGYGYQEGRYGVGSSRIRNHSIDVGLNYNKALSFSRRTTFSFGTGTTAVTDGESTQYHATGNAQLNHEIGRTWRATISYDRSLQFVGTLLAPVFYDSASAGLGGLVNRRVRIGFSARASFGSIGLGSRAHTNNDFDTYQGGASVAFALSRYFDLGIDYSIYRYRFDAGAVLPVNVPKDVERQSVLAHIDVWAPLFQRARRNNASR